MGRDNPNNVNRQPPASSGDFGVPAEPASADRAYARATVKQHDPGAVQERSGAQGVRTSGVGSNASGRGSGSGGDIDTGDDALAGVTDDHANPPPDRPTAAGPAARKPLPPGSVFTTLDPDTQFDGTTGAANVNNPGRNDDAFAGEITPDEVLGQE